MPFWEVSWQGCAAELQGAFRKWTPMTWDDWSVHAEPRWTTGSHIGRASEPLSLRYRQVTNPLATQRCSSISPLNCSGLPRVRHAQAFCEGNLKPLLETRLQPHADNETYGLDRALLMSCDAALRHMFFPWSKDQVTTFLISAYAAYVVEGTNVRLRSRKAQSTKSRRLRSRPGLL